LDAWYSDNSGIIIAKYSEPSEGSSSEDEAEGSQADEVSGSQEAVGSSVIASLQTEDNELKTVIGFDSLTDT
jgi:hypothetical protein